MKHLKILLGVALFLFTGQFISAQNYPIVPIPFQKVQLEDRFWAPRLEVVRKVTIPVTFQKNEETGRLKNFDIAAGHTSGNVCTQFPFDDSDVYKSIEGAAISLTNHRDAKLEARVDSMMRLIAAERVTRLFLVPVPTMAARLTRARSAEP